MLAPGTGKTRTGRLWVYLRDERPHGGTSPPAVLYRYTPDRKGEHCRAELAPFVGYLHADDYAGFGKLYEIAGARFADAMLMQGPPRVAEVGCWSHVRRGFHDEWASHKSAIAKEALDRIGALFDIERTIAGHSADIRRAVRQRSKHPAKTAGMGGGGSMSAQTGLRGSARAVAALVRAAEGVVAAAVGSAFCG